MDNNEMSPEVLALIQKLNERRVLGSTPTPMPQQPLVTQEPISTPGLTPEEIQQLMLRMK